MRTKIYFLRGENRFVVYVGKTRGVLQNRLNDHLREARKGHHCKKCHGIRKMLREGKVPTITLQTEVEGNGNNAERAYIKWLRSYGIDLWNLTDGGDGQSKGYVTSEATKQKLRLIVPSVETKRRISQTLMGHDVREETRRKIRESHTGVKLSDTHRKRISESHIGFIVSEKTKRKISESTKGRVGKPLSAETRRKIGLKHKGKIISEETRQKISKSLLGTHYKPRRCLNEKQ